MEVLSLILPVLYLGCAIWRDCLAQTPLSIPKLQQLAKATQIGEPTSYSTEVRQLVDHLIEVVPHQIKTIKCNIRKLKQVVSQRPIFSSKASISR